MKQRQQRAAARHGPEAEKIVKRLRDLQSMSGHNLSRLWDDWVSSMALAVANGCDHRPKIRAEREAEYMQIVARHGKDAMDAFSEMFAMLVRALDADAPTDVLGGVFMGLEMGSDHAGQFFTPSGVCELMTAMTLGDDAIKGIVESGGWVTIQEPAIGGGAMVIPVVARVREAGFSPSTHLHVTGVDVDSSVLRMAYVQLSLLGVPAVLYVGNTLTMVMREDWYTPAHVFGGWGPRLRARAEREGISKAIDRVREVVGAGSDAAEVDVDEPKPAQGSLFEGLGC